MALTLIQYFARKESKTVAVGAWCSASNGNFNMTFTDTERANTHRLSLDRAAANELVAQLGAYLADPDAHNSRFDKAL